MVSLAWSTATPNGATPTVTVATTRQPRPVCPLHAAPLITDTVSPVEVSAVPLFAVYTVSVARSTSTQSGPALTGTVRAGRPHPRVVLALHAATLITDTLPPARLATYKVRVTGLTTPATGNCPTLTVATGRAQPLVTCALHRAPFSTESVLLIPFTT